MIDRRRALNASLKGNHSFRFFESGGSEDHSRISIARLMAILICLCFSFRRDGSSFIVEIFLR